jgi:cell division protein FtsI (penicillin-binding protein 3)
MALFPSDQPKYIVYVVIKRPRGEEYFGGRIAVPVAREVIEFLLGYYPDLTGDRRLATHSGRIRVHARRLPEIGGEMPDLTGLPKRTLLPLYEHESLAVDIHGSGWVVAQTPAPGEPILPGTTIRLELE